VAKVLPYKDCGYISRFCVAVLNGFPHSLLAKCLHSMLALRHATASFFDLFPALNIHHIVSRSNCYKHIFEMEYLKYYTVTCLLTCDKETLVT
jgi:hypothetical protein